MTEHSERSVEASDPSATGPRRNFLVELAAVVTGAVVALVPLIGAAVMFLNPLVKRKGTDEPSDSDGFLMVGRTGSLTPQGPPQLFKVSGTKQDAWTTYPETALGAVYVRMHEDESLECFNARCPHLGCMVNFKPGVGEYVCPCHDSSFNLAGERSNEIPPRDMDPLDCEIRNENEIWVRFQNFRAGTHERKPV